MSDKPRYTIDELREWQSTISYHRLMGENQKKLIDELLEAKEYILELEERVDRRHSDERAQLNAVRERVSQALKEPYEDRTEVLRDLANLLDI